jgi:hypothetical protein
MNEKKTSGQRLIFNENPKEEQSRKYILRKREEFEANKEMKTFFYDYDFEDSREELTNKHGD